MVFRHCPACGRAALQDDAEIGGQRCKLCARAFHIIDLDRVPVDGGKQAKRIAAAQARKAEKAETKPATSDKPLSPAPVVHPHKPA